MHVLTDINVYEPHNEYNARINNGAVYFVGYEYEVKTAAYKTLSKVLPYYMYTLLAYMYLYNILVLLLMIYNKYHIIGSISDFLKLIKFMYVNIHAYVNNTYNV